MHQRQAQNKLLVFNAQVHQAILQVVLPHLPLGIAGRDLDDTKLWEILCHAAVKQSFIETSCRALEAAPSGNTVRAHLTDALGDDETALAQLEERLNHALQAQLPAGVRRKLAARAWEAAGDWVDIPYHGQVADADETVRPSQPKAGTTHFHAYASLAVLRKGRRFTLALTLVRKGETMDAVVARLLERVRQLGARFQCTYWDKAFGAVGVFRYLRAHRVPYVIALAQRGGAQGIKRWCRGRCSRDAQHIFNATKKPYRTSVVIACHYAGRTSKRRPKKKKRGLKYYAYAVYRVRGRSPQAISAAYRRRFSIESGYRQAHQVRARTCSRHTGLRLLLMGLALLLVNLYLLLRASWTQLTSYGQRVAQHRLTLDHVASALQHEIEGLLGFAPVFYCRASGGSG